MICTPRMLVLGASLCCVNTLQAQVAQNWTIELQARSTLEASLPGYNLPYPSALSSQYVSIDDDGGVAIRVIMGNGQEGIFYGKNRKGGIIVTGNGGGDSFWSTTLDLRNGMIAIEQGSFNDGAYLYSIDGTLLRTFAAGGSEGVSGFSGVTLTSDGALCYRGDFGFTLDKVVIDEFIGDSRVQTLITDTGSDYTFLISPEINDARQVLMKTFPATGPAQRIVRFEPDGSPTTVAETGAMFNSFVNSTAIAQNGDAAFSARRSSDSIWQVTRWDGSSSINIADGSNPDIDNGSLANFPPVINSNGTVAFRATDIEHDSTALWVGDGTDLVKLVEYDQMIETDLGPMALGFDFGGDTGRQVMNGVVDINDAGQVAFAAFLRNGTIGVFVATPDGGCPADFDGNGAVDFFDISAFVAAFQAGDPAADFTGDGSFDFFDVSAFVGAYAQGCP
ncbi:MAG: GC-type dockerin domain-anchored protein [Phycisphaerales bacterium JB052]